ncbi:MAG: methyltransferase [Streptosporangiaceae bacterium]
MGGRGYAAARAEAAGTSQAFSYLGLTLVVPPEVQPITGMSHLLGESILAEVRDDDRVLDMGTGCGVNAILAARTARQILAVDINPHAIAAARQNAARNGVADRVEIRHSDVFGAVEGTFDLIIFDPPFRWFRPRDLLEAASTDAGYRALTAFFRGARRHLTGRGRMLIFFGTSGDLAYLRKLADEVGFRAEVLTRQELVRDDWQVEYFTFRMTPDGWMTP